MSEVELLLEKEKKKCTFITYSPVSCPFYTYGVLCCWEVPAPVFLQIQER